MRRFASQICRNERPVCGVGEGPRIFQSTKHDRQESRKRRSRRAHAIAAAAIAGLCTLVLPVTANAAHGPRLIPVAGGLDNPHALAFLPDGKLAVAESGHAGNLCSGPGQCAGLSAQVVAITPRTGHTTALATGLPSLGGAVRELWFGRARRAEQKAVLDCPNQSASAW